VKEGELYMETLSGRGLKTVKEGELYMKTLPCRGLETMEEGELYNGNSVWLRSQNCERR